VLLIYTVNSVKSLCNDRGNKLLCKNVKDPFSFEIWIFLNGQPDYDDNRRIFIEMTSNYEQRNLA
jgi:hypothetical protein